MKSVSENEILEGANLLRAGRLVAFPTETVYGLGANALDEDAVALIFEAKGRPSTSPLIVHVYSIELAKQLTTFWDERAPALAAAFWPGPLTLIMAKHPRVSDRVTAGLNTVALRMPNHPVALALLKAAGLPIAAPSANRFTELSPTTADHVKASLGERVDMILDGGATTVGIESTVLSLTENPAVLLRPGMITQQQLEAVIGPISVRTETVPEGVSHSSPGQHERHYSPNTPFYLMPAEGFTLAGKDGNGSGRAIPMPANVEEYAASLYAVLHELDQEGWEVITAETPPDTQEWAGVIDRLRRAATK